MKPLDVSDEEAAEMGRLLKPLLTITICAPAGDDEAEEDGEAESSLAADGKARRGRG